MSTITLQQNAVSQLALQAAAVGKLAQDIGAFAAVVAAFESNDPDALTWVLQRLELLPQCEVICEWIRVKWWGLRCVEVCGPLDPKVPVPNLNSTKTGQRSFKAALHSLTHSGTTSARHTTWPAFATRMRRKPSPELS